MIVLQSLTKEWKKENIRVNMMNKENEWFALMNKDKMFFSHELLIPFWKRHKFNQGCQWESSPYLRNKKATKIYLKPMQKKYGGEIVRFVKYEGEYVETK